MGSLGLPLVVPRYSCSRTRWDEINTFLVGVPEDAIFFGLNSTEEMYNCPQLIVVASIVVELLEKERMQFCVEGRDRSKLDQGQDVLQATLSLHSEATSPVGQIFGIPLL